MGWFSSIFVSNTCLRILRVPCNIWQSVGITTNRVDNVTIFRCSLSILSSWTTQMHHLVRRVGTNLNNSEPTLGLPQHGLLPLWGAVGLFMAIYHQVSNEPLIRLRSFLLYLELHLHAYSACMCDSTQKHSHMISIYDQQFNWKSCMKNHMPMPRI